MHSPRRESSAPRARPPRAKQSPAAPRGAAVRADAPHATARRMHAPRGAAATAGARRWRRAPRWRAPRSACGVRKAPWRARRAAGGRAAGTRDPARSARAARAARRRLQSPRRSGRRRIDRRRTARRTARRQPTRGRRRGAPACMRWHGMFKRGVARAAAGVAFGTHRRFERGEPKAERAEEQLRVAEQPALAQPPARGGVLNPRAHEHVRHQRDQLVRAGRGAAATTAAPTAERAVLITRVRLRTFGRLVRRLARRRLVRLRQLPLLVGRRLLLSAPRGCRTCIDEASELGTRRGAATQLARGLDGRGVRQLGVAGSARHVQPEARVESEVTRQQPLERLDASRDGSILGRVRCSQRRPQRRVAQREEGVVARVRGGGRREAAVVAEHGQHL